MPLNTPLLLGDQPKVPFNLSGRWKIGPNAFLGIRHWSFLANAVWSTREYVGGEVLTGLLSQKEGQWILIAYFGSAMPHEGYVLNEGATLKIVWQNGSTWTRLQKRGQLPRRSISGVDSLWKYLCALPCRLRPVAAGVIAFCIALCCLLSALVLKYSALIIKHVDWIATLSVIAKLVHVMGGICLVLDTAILVVLALWWCCLLTPSTNTGTCWGDIAEQCTDTLRTCLVFAIAAGALIWIALFVLLMGSWTVAMWFSAILVISMSLACLAKLCYSCANGELIRSIVPDSPSRWPEVCELGRDDPDFVRICNLFEQRCRPWFHMYPFALSLEKVYEVSNPELQAKFDEASAAMEPQHGNHVQQLFHGSNMTAIRSIIQDGFRLPTMAGMFGKGIYFADTPLKSWQYSAKKKGTLMLLCDVALGNEKKVKHAASRFDPKRDFKPSWLHKMFGQKPFDSVVALPRCEGGAVNVPEYVVYNEAQTMPRYILHCAESK
eukprot:TRINITY_DN40989_c0_g1_i1.p1 TRINITY_DN40989_c0_g1~~TRINITY_DN40989_c0_g1_i1.p1  ORF type:complete len:493 (+),score=28.09 TRINITY_DN40989_c0_g1_i1:41-1519(+)